MLPYWGTSEGSGSLPPSLDTKENGGTGASGNEISPVRIPQSTNCSTKGRDNCGQKGCVSIPHPIPLLFLSPAPVQVTPWSKSFWVRTLASLAPQASKPSLHGEVILQRARGKGRLIQFPGLLSPTTPSRSPAQRQVPIRRAALGNPWPVAPTQWKLKAGCSNGLLSSKGENVSLSDSLRNPLVCGEHPFSSPTSKPKPVWLELYLYNFYEVIKPFWTSSSAIKRNTLCCSTACDSKFWPLKINKSCNVYHLKQIPTVSNFKSFFS